MTQAGCGAICPAYRRGCYGCFGPKETTNTGALAAWWGRLGVTDARIVRTFRAFSDLQPCAEGMEQVGMEREAAMRMAHLAWLVFSLPADPSRPSGPGRVQHV